MPRKRRAYKRDYAELYDNPYLLFPGGPDHRGVSVKLWPNGSNAIWLQDARGHGVEITAGAGPAGFGLNIRSFVGGAPITMTGNLADNHLTTAAPGDFKYIDLCQYNGDEKSQAFKAWYLGDHDDPNRPPHPPDMTGPSQTGSGLSDPRTIASITPKPRPDVDYFAADTFDPVE
jgi:hypothetical protein